MEGRTMSSQRWLLPLVLLPLFTVAGSTQQDVKIGDRIGELRFIDIHYLRRTLDDFGSKKALVLVFTNTSCPVAKRYLPVLEALAKDYATKDVQFVAVNAAEEDSILAMATQAVEYDVSFPFVKDPGGVCARALGVRRTPEVVVLDEKRHVRYRGRIDDQYRQGGARATATRHDLKEALDAVLAGREVAVAQTEVDGCPITPPSPRRDRGATTFAEHVAPILQKHCWQCHQSGGSAPFALTSYKDAASRALSLVEVVSSGRMPPWFASHEFGPFVNRRGLTEDECAIILDWATSGKSQGDAKRIPPLPAAPPSKWLIGEPDLVLETPVHELPAAGDIPYKYAILKHVFDEDTWVQRVQIVADNPRVMHHCNLAFGTLATGVKEENFITGNVPGGEVMALDDGIAFRIPKGAMLGLQIHYVSTGKPEKCRVAVGLRWPRDVVQKQLRHMQISDNRFAIPPGAAAHKVSAERVLDRDAIGVGLFAHMHLRGKDMSFTAHLPDGKSERLLIVPNYSFSWQIPYRWEPGQKRWPKGTRLECVAHFDNSVFNPFNPDPKATVRPGPQTHEEMMFGFFFYIDAAEELGVQVDPKTGRKK
jgi:thiol-disulfide isomerase/thioredoxin